MAEIIEKKGFFWGILRVFRRIAAAMMGVGVIMAIFGVSDPDHIRLIVGLVGAALGFVGFMILDLMLKPKLG